MKNKICQYIYNFECYQQFITIKSNTTNDLCIFCISFVFILINSIIILTFSNNYQVVFSQGYIPPPTNNIQSKSIQQCTQIGIIGPTYKGLDGCPKPCPTNDNIPTGCPVNPISKGGDIHIGNQSGQTQTNTPSGSCLSGVQTFAACNLGNSQGRANSDDNATNKGNTNP